MKPFFLRITPPRVIALALPTQLLSEPLPVVQSRKDWANEQKIDAELCLPKLIVGTFCFKCRVAIGPFCHEEEVWLNPVFSKKQVLTFQIFCGACADENDLSFDFRIIDPSMMELFLERDDVPLFIKAKRKELTDAWYYSRQSQSLTRARKG